MGFLTQYSNTFPENADIVFLTKLYKEYYQRNFPLLTYRSLKDDTSTPHSFYNQATREDRKYDDHSMNIRVDLGSIAEEEILSQQGIEEEKQISFFVLYPFFEDILLIPAPDPPEVQHLEPKIGDVILFEYPGQEYEVLTVKFPGDTYFAHSNYNFERELLCKRPDLGK